MGGGPSVLHDPTVSEKKRRLLAKRSVGEWDLFVCFLETVKPFMMIFSVWEIPFPPGPQDKE